MQRMYIARQCCGLSDEGIEDAIYGSQWRLIRSKTHRAELTRRSDSVSRAKANCSALP
jgi:hypothetical protein